MSAIARAPLEEIERVEALSIFEQQQLIELLENPRVQEAAMEREELLLREEFKRGERESAIIEAAELVDPERIALERADEKLSEAGLDVGGPQASAAQLALLPIVQDIARIPVEQPDSAQEERDEAREEDRKIERDEQKFPSGDLRRLPPENENVLADDEKEYGSVFDLSPEPLVNIPPSRTSVFLDSSGRLVREIVSETIIPIVQFLEQPASEAIQPIGRMIDILAPLGPLEGPEGREEIAEAEIPDMTEEELKQIELAREEEIEAKLPPAISISPEGRLVSADQIRRNLIAEDIQPFSTNDFNKVLIKEIIKDNVDQKGDIVNTALLADELKQIMVAGFKQTLRSERPGVNSLRAISTLATAIHEAVEEGEINDSEALQRIVEESFSSLVGKTIIPTMVGRLIPNLDEMTEKIFLPEINELRSMERLTVPQMNRVRRSIERFLNTMRQNILDGEIPVPSEAFEILRTYLQRNIPNEQLRNMLLREVEITRRTIQSFEDQMRARIPPSIVPRTDTQGMLVSTSQTLNLVGNIYSTIILNAERVIQENSLLPETRLTAAQINVRNRLFDEMKLSIIRANEIVNKHGLRVRVPGAPVSNVIIPLRNDDGSSKSIFELLRDTKQVRDIILRTDIQFFRNPSAIDEASGVTEQKFFQDISREREPIERMPRRPRHKRTTVPKPSGLTKLGNIKILETEGSNVREIDIPAGSKISDVIKLATILTMEEGLLEDIGGKLLIRIRKNQADVTNIVNIIVDHLHVNAGHDIKLLYVPSDPMGGHFLSGFLSNMFDVPLVSKGGSLRSTGFMLHNALFPLSEIPLSMFTRFRKFL